MVTFTFFSNHLLLCAVYEIIPFCLWTMSFSDCHRCVHENRHSYYYYYYYYFYRCSPVIAMMFFESCCGALLEGESLASVCLFLFFLWFFKGRPGAWCLADVMSRAHTFATKKLTVHKREYGTSVFCPLILLVQILCHPNWVKTRFGFLWIKQTTHAQHTPFCSLLLHFNPNSHTHIKWREPVDYFSTSTIACEWHFPMEGHLSAASWPTIRTWILFLAMPRNSERSRSKAVCTHRQ